MDINAAFPSAFLKAADLQGRRVAACIDSVAMEDIGSEQKPVVYFQGKEKGLVLNKTNANMISEIAKSTDTDHWTGVHICLYPTKTDFQGRRVDAIRVDYPATNGAQRQAPPPVQHNDMGDDIPF
jgi:hypothetical protein